MRSELATVRYIHSFADAVVERPSAALLSRYQPRSKISVAFAVQAISVWLYGPRPQAQRNKGLPWLFARYISDGNYSSMLPLVTTIYQFMSWGFMR